jgi:asparagine synthase (glutamine-hydrolysing)
MSVQFGRWNFDTKPIDQNHFAKVSEMAAQYAPGDSSTELRDDLGMLYRPLHITTESVGDLQPIRTAAGVLLTWDGRLDNRDELLRELGINAEASPSDARIVALAYEKWAARAFSRLLGDWALALWDPTRQQVLLAKDFVGTRHLFYSQKATHVEWSTVLDPLVLLSGGALELSEEYIAGYLSSYPSTHLTPYVGIHSVPAGNYTKVTRRGCASYSYWSPDSSLELRYRTDAEYEEHFRSVFAQSVRRRLRSSFPVLAELSGGIDSASIVCVADQLIAQRTVETPRVDTVSYYDDQEPNWNERPYFSMVEAKRGRPGSHLDIGALRSAFEEPDRRVFFPLPGHDKLHWDRAVEFSKCSEVRACRVLLSGIGGDEFLGGLPSPTAELQDLFVGLRLTRFFHQLLAWSLAQRRPWLHLWFDVIEEFFPDTLRRLYKKSRVPCWLSGPAVRRHSNALEANSPRLRLGGPRPSFQTNLSTLRHIRRQLNDSHLTPARRYRVTYPYLDRDLLTFLFAIPREQLVRPHQRRSLMRRALAGIVPAEILGRRRKAFIARRPLLLVEYALPQISRLLGAPVTISSQWVRSDLWPEVLSAVKQGKGNRIVPLITLFRLELWFQTLLQRGLLATGGFSASVSALGPGSNEIQLQTS